MLRNGLGILASSLFEFLMSTVLNPPTEYDIKLEMKKKARKQIDKAIQAALAD